MLSSRSFLTRSGFAAAASGSRVMNGAANVLPDGRLLTSPCALV
jgi:hypothetical protein